MTADARVLVLRASVQDIAPTFIDWTQVAAWLRRWGVERAVALAVFERAGRYELHVTEQLVNSRGEVVLDHASDRVATIPRIVDIGTERDWPEHLNNSHYRAREGAWLPSDTNLVDAG